MPDSGVNSLSRQEFAIYRVIRRHSTHLGSGSLQISSWSLRGSTLHRNTGTSPPLSRGSANRPLDENSTNTCRASGRTEEYRRDAPHIDAARLPELDSDRRFRILLSLTHPFLVFVCRDYSNVSRIVRAHIVDTNSRSARNSVADTRGGFSSSARRCSRRRNALYISCRRRTSFSARQAAAARVPS